MANVPYQASSGDNVVVQGVDGKSGLIALNQILGSASLTGFTSGAVLLAGSKGLISQDVPGIWFDTTNNQLLVGTTITPIAATGVPFQGLASNAASLQMNVQNSSNGGSASSDYIATADTGTNTTNYVDFGINSSAYNDAAFTITGALDAYHYNVGGDFAIGTATATKVLKLHTGGTLLANLRATLSDTALTLASGVGLASAAGMAISSAAANTLTVTSGTTGAITVDSGSTGAVNVGTGASAKTVTIGNVTGASAVSIKSGTGGTKFTGSVRYNFGSVVTNSGATLTLTGAQMAAGTVFQETGTTAATFTLDTGANLSAAISGVAVGDTVEFMVSNASTQTITMAGATGTTLANAMTVPTLTSRVFWAVNTGTNTWTIY